MKQHKFFVLLIIPAILIIGMKFRQPFAPITYYSTGSWDTAMSVATKTFNILGRDKGPNGKLLTDLELALMDNIDQVYRRRSKRGYEVTSGLRNVEKAVQLRRWHGVPTPVILLWSYKSDDVQEKLFDSKCGGCRVTPVRSVMNDSVAVVFLFRNHHDLPDPKQRRASQSYVFRSREAISKLVPQRKYLEVPSFDPIFNLTMNYRRDSDIVCTMGSAEAALRESKESQPRTNYDNILKMKTRQALWFVSNCYRTPGSIARMRYAMMMVKAGLKLDKFGECFTEGERQKGGVSQSSLKYKFYLAFENSIHCPSYITEKLWRNSFQGLAVPIIFGPTKADVEAIAPKHSYIHTEDYASPAELVKYLNYLDKNDTAYMEYHAWRYKDVNQDALEEDIEPFLVSALCRLCKRLVLENHPPKTIPSITKWFYDDTNYVDNECLTPRYKIEGKERDDMDEFCRSPNAYEQP